ncbi:hypothetical protein [Sorangium cellulosum]|uniref:hypothetical protein n=1 Tax=Sorangium cellulosum TaxID=56 RepID=UPI001331A144|nr:hypothetical protein [Sorangium cellulosum]
MLTVPPPTRPPHRKLALAALLAACACQPAPAPSSPQDADAPQPPAPGDAAPAGQPPAPPGQPPAPPPRDTAAPPAQAAAGSAARATLEARTPVKLAPPPFGEALFRPAPGGGAAAPRLVKLSEKKNTITDEAEWFTRNGVALPLLQVPDSPWSGPGPLPASVPTWYRPTWSRGLIQLVKAIDHGDHLALFYGPSPIDGRFLAILDEARRVVAFFDFESFLAPTESEPNDAAFVRGELRWAEVKDGVLYVATGHRTYAASSKGKNAYLSALDLASGQLLWQSAPLVCNAGNFVLRGDHLLCGYGFTAEPDFLYVLERTTGKITSKIPLKSGPDVLIEKDGKLFVRTYDTDYVFEIR